MREVRVAAHVHGESGLDGPDLPPPAGKPGDRHAVDFLADTIRAHDGRVTLVPTGPLTNIALLLALHPDARPERVVLMGGAIGEGNITPAAEFNIWADPEAAKRVFAAAGREITVEEIPIETLKRELVRAGVPPWNAEGLSEQFAMYAGGGLQMVTSGVKDALGRDPRTIDEFASDHVDAFKEQA